MIYRAVAAKLLERGADPEDAAAAAAVARALVPADLERPDLREEAISQASSKVAALPEVRSALLNFQRRFAHAPPGGKAGAVLDGRDIGTVVCPDAEVKIFITASPETRAQRRHKELIDGGKASIYPRVLQEMRERDARDGGRAAAPLRPAEGATVMDTTEMDADAVLEAALQLVARCAPPGTPGPRDDEN